MLKMWNAQQRQKQQQLQQWWWKFFGKHTTTKKNKIRKFAKRRKMLENPQGKCRQKLKKETLDVELHDELCLRRNMLRLDCCCGGMNSTAPSDLWPVCRKREFTTMDPTMSVGCSIICKLSVDPWLSLRLWGCVVNGGSAVVSVCPYSNMWQSRKWRLMPVQGIARATWSLSSVTCWIYRNILLSSR